MTRIEVENLKISKELYTFIEAEVVEGLDIDARGVFKILDQLVQVHSTRNHDLLEKRDDLQRQLDGWHEARKGGFEFEEYLQFLKDIGYLHDPISDFQIEPGEIDREISGVSGPQLVVPVDNARFCLNAANARWGSLFDALYGSNVIPKEGALAPAKEYNPGRGQKVFEFATGFLDTAIPLEQADHSQVVEYQVDDKAPARLKIKLADDRTVSLADLSQFRGYSVKGSTTTLLFSNNDLYFEVQVDKQHEIGSNHPAGIKDIILESAITTIQDCEDSVAAVDAEDKVGVYRNWLGLMKGNLSASFSKGGRVITRALNADRTYQSVDGSEISLTGRSLLLVRNVGIHMYTDAVVTSQGEKIPEGFLDALVTSLIALHDIKGNSVFKNSVCKNIYIVKPKLHGPEEVAATVSLFNDVELALGLPENTIKIGIMDEERRTSVNLAHCIYEARKRVFFINTGFLDRTGDEIHTSFRAGAMLPKAEIKKQAWLEAYERSNVSTGLQCGFSGRAQVGKGMWAVPDDMKTMLEAKVAHLKAGATTAWVPSPTAATLHALHYHELKVNKIHEQLHSDLEKDRLEILKIPLLGSLSLSQNEIVEELENNIQGLLGYVARWVGQGVGCSKVPDIHDIGLMEDRATLRISSQHVANWLYHGIVSEEQVKATLKKMVSVVDRQNAGDEQYTPMGGNIDESIEFEAASALIFNGHREKNGYTESMLERFRRKKKELNSLPVAS